MCAYDNIDNADRALRMRRRVFDYCEYMKYNINGSWNAVGPDAIIYRRFVDVKIVKSNENP